jgi:XapX domain-containing protein
MKVYFISLGLGLIVGVLYSLVQVRSPAPPLIALVGLFGILAGEQMIPVVKKLWQGPPFHRVSRADGAQHPVSGRLPGRHGGDSPTSDSRPPASGETSSQSGTTDHNA